MRLIHTCVCRKTESPSRMLFSMRWPVTTGSRLRAGGRGGGAAGEQEVGDGVFRLQKDTARTVNPQDIRESCGALRGSCS